MIVTIENKMTLRQTIAGFIYLPFHFFILPLCLPLLVKVLPLDDITVNVLYYAIGILFVAAVMMPYLRRCFDFLVDNPLLALLIFLAMMGVYYLLSLAVNLVMEIIEMPLAQAPNDTAVSELAQRDMGIMKSIAIFIAPVVEEILFRGVIFGSLRGKSCIAAYAVSVLLFSLFHVWEYVLVFHDASQLLFIIQYIPVSIALAYGYDKTGCIWVPIAFHMLNNAAAFAISGF